MSIQRTEMAGLPAIRSEGSGRTFPLLFVHGAFGQHEQFRDWVEFFARSGFDSFAVSLRGRHGTPPEGGAGVRFDDLLDDVVRAAGALPATPAIIGHSLGGLLALKAGEAGACRAAVSLGGAAPREVMMRLVQRPRALPMLLRLGPDVLRGRPFLPAYDVAERLWFNRVPVESRPRLYGELVPESGAALRSAFVGVPIDRAHVRCPLLLVGADDDLAAPPRITRATGRRFGADVRIYPRHGHWMIAEPGWEQIAGDIVAWLDERVGASGPAAASGDPAPPRPASRRYRDRSAEGAGGEGLP